jgi:hypothetical protein
MIFSADNFSLQRETYFSEDVSFQRLVALILLKEYSKEINDFLRRRLPARGTLRFPHKFS